MSRTPKPRCANSKEVLAHVDGSKPVHVYRNLHKKCLSVRQGGKVVCHVDNIVLKDAIFHVNENGRQKVLATKQKNVHAYVKGMVIDARETDELLPLWGQITYDPYKGDSFNMNGIGVSAAMYVDIDIDDGSVDMMALGLTWRANEQSKVDG
jgi:hypothetical protein